MKSRWPHPHVRLSAQRRTKQTSGLVLLLDSSESASNAQEYAVHIAAAKGLDITLMYIIDLDQFPESENPVSMSRLLTREHRMRSERFESCKAKAKGKGIRITCSDPLVVSVFHVGLLHENIRRLAPDLLVVARTSFSKTLLKAIIKRTSFPVLVVPEVSLICKPRSLLLCSDGKGLQERDLHALLDFATSTRQQVGMLSIVKSNRVGIRKVQSYLPPATNRSLVDFYRHAGVNSVLTIEKFVRERSFDMVSMVLSDHRWMRRFFSRWSFMDLAYGINVPLLLFKSNRSAMNQM